MNKNNKNKRKQNRLVLLAMATLVLILAGSYVMYKLADNAVRTLAFEQEEYSETLNEKPGIIETTSDPQTITISLGGREHSAGLRLGVHSVNIKNNTLLITAGYSMSDAITSQKSSGALANKITLTKSLPEGNYKVKLNMINLGSVTVKPDWSQTGLIYNTDFTIN